MKELLQKRATVFEQARALILKAEGEHRALTSEEQTQYDARMADVEALGKTIERSRQSSDMNAEFERSLGPRGGDQPGLSDPNRRNSPGSDLADAAMNTFLRNGRDAMTTEQRGLFATADGFKDGIQIRSASPLSAVTPAAGAYTIPNGFVSQLEENLKWFGGMRKSRATVIRTATGNPLPWPTVDDTSNTGEQVAENIAITQATTEMTFGVVNFGAWKFSSKLVLVPIELMQDSAFNVQGLVATLLGQRLGRIQNAKYTTGAGTTTCNGAVTAATSGKTSASATAIIYDELVDLEHSVDPAYRVGAEWMFNDTTAALLEKLKDNNGRPLLNESFAAIAANIKAGDANAPVRYTIKGYPVALNSDMAAPTAGLKPVLFGDMSKYVIRDVMDVMLVRFGEKYMDQGQIGFVCFMRSDGNLVDAGAHPLKYLTMHA